jgi:hypothetical protein
VLRSKIAFAAGLLFAAPFAALAGPISATSYSMFNGGTGSYDYRDTTYSNCPGSDCDTTGASLSGGTGKLTDGVFPTLDWITGPPEGWVGWDSAELNGANPTVTFSFGGTETIDSVTVWFDNTLGVGGVGAPGSVSINGTNYSGIPQNTSGPQAFTVSGLDITGSSVNVQFFQNPSDVWLMIGEVSFDGSSTAPAPEPSTVTLIVVGGLGVGLLRRLRFFVYRG